MYIHIDMNLNINITSAIGFFLAKGIIGFLQKHYLLPKLYSLHFVVFQKREPPKFPITLFQWNMCYI